MIFKYITSILLFCGLCFSEQISHLQPTGFVNDYAKVLSPQQEESLEQLLYTTSVTGLAEIAVITINSTDGESIEDYTMNLAESWKVGKKGSDNGIILLVAIEDRAIRLEVGYGLEHILNDAKCGRIIDDHIIPSFKQNEFNYGIINGVAEIIVELKNYQTIEDDKPLENPNAIPIVAFLVCSIFFVFIIIIYLNDKTSDKCTTVAYPSRPPPQSPPPQGTQSPRKSVYYPTTARITNRPSSISISKPSSTSSFGGFKSFGGGSFGGGASRKW